MRGLSLVAVCGAHSSLRCTGLSLSRPLLLRSTGSRRAGSVVVAHGPSCPAACGIFPDQGSNPCPLHWQADSQPLRHQGSPGAAFFTGHTMPGSAWVKWPLQASTWHPDAWSQNPRVFETKPLLEVFKVIMKLASPLRCPHDLAHEVW